MCIKCLMAALAAASAKLNEELAQQPTDKLKAMGTAPASGEPELSYAAQQDRDFDAIQLDSEKARVNKTSADTVVTLAHAAQILYNINETSAVKRVIGLIEEQVPAKPDPEPAPMQEEAVSADRDVYIVFNGASGTGKTVLSQSVLKALCDSGFAVREVEGHIDTLCILNPAETIRTRDRKPAVDAATSRKQRIHAAYAALEAEGLRVVETMAIG